MPGWHLPTRSRPFLVHDSLRRFAGAWCWRPVSAARRNRPPHLAALCENYCYRFTRLCAGGGMRRTKLRTSRRPSSQRLLEKNDLAAARPERGRFRSFLLTSLKHFLANEWDRARAEKRGGGRSAANRLWDCRGAVPCRTEPRPDAQEDLRAAWGAGAARMLRVLDCRLSSLGLKPVRCCKRLIRRNRTSYCVRSWA
jgi:hypothetical protein